MALDDVSIDIAPGEVHAILGENGAGKSTLMKIAYGQIEPDHGTVSMNSRARTRGLGIGMVHQHFTSIDSLTVAENIALAAGWPVRPRVMNDKARELAERLALPIEPTVLAGSLSAGMKQRLELLKALSTEAQILLLDEPTSILAPPDIEALMTLIGALRGRGITVVFITHKLGEALAIADRVTVLRRGKVMLSGPATEMSRELIVEAMIGGTQMATDGAQMATEKTQMATDGTQMAADACGGIAVSSVAICVKRIGETGSGLRSATFELHPGEIVGVAAVEGSGQRELFRAIAGLVQPSSGSLTVSGKVSFIPEDRTSEGSIQGFALAENLALVMGDEAPWVRRPWIHWDEAKARMATLVDEFDVRGDAEVMGGLSGGNQQKVIVAAALERKPAVLLAENPTRGLDIKASADVLSRLKEAARDGVAVMVHLPDLDELLPLVDRVVVLNNGVLTTMPAGSDRTAVGIAMVSAS